MPNIIKKIQNTLFQHSLIKKNAKLVLAVSGGPDSVFLLDIFSKLQKKYALKLIIAHVNYGLRESDSDGDEEFVRKLAEKYSLEVIVLRPKVRSKSNLENNLRDIRYTFFEKVRQKNGFDLIVTAHNADDQVETFFLHLFRGAGLSGLSSMKYKNGYIIRPILNLWKKEILGYLKDKQLSYRTDRTNLENNFTRNKLRNIFIPKIEEEFNPNIKETIFQATESIGEDYAFIKEFSEKIYRKNQPLSAKKILSHHPAVQRRILLEAIRNVAPDLRNIESANLEEILKTLKSTKNKHQFVVFKGLKLEKKGDRITIEKVKNK